MRTTPQSLQSQAMRSWDRVRRVITLNREITMGIAFMAFLIVVGTGGTLIIPLSTASKVDLTQRLLSPSSANLLGTDVYGRDILSMIVLATTYDLSISVIVVLVSATVGLFIGTLSAYRGGLTDEGIMRVTDVFLSFPPLILAMAVASVIGRSYLGLILTLLLVQWTGYVRLSRSQVLSEKQRLYVIALRKLGVPARRIIFLHLIRNTMFPVIVNATLDLARVILIIAGLSFLGFGAGPLSPDWGTMIAQGIQYFFTSPWPVVWPGFAILVAAFSFNLLGDGLRDALDPRVASRL